MPRPLLACCSNRLLVRGGSFLASEWIAGSENLHLFAWRIAELPAKERLHLAAACAEQLGRLIGRMHAAGAVHRDLKAANFLARDASGGVEVWLVDLDGLQIGRRINVARRARNVARLAAGLAAHPWVMRSIGRRFLRAYELEFPPGAIEWKSLWRAIAQRTAAIVRRKRRRGEEVL